jgi:hypothetical protein
MSHFRTRARRYYRSSTNRSVADLVAFLTQRYSSALDIPTIASEREMRTE